MPLDPNCHFIWEIAYQVAPFDDAAPQFQSLQSHGPFPSPHDRDTYLQTLLKRRRSEGFDRSPCNNYVLMRGDLATGGVGVVFETDEDIRPLEQAIARVLTERGR